jgi:hypothetical protein
MDLEREDVGMATVTHARNVYLSENWSKPCGPFAKQMELDFCLLFLPLTVAPYSINF